MSESAERWSTSTRTLLPLIDGIARRGDDGGTAEEVAGYMRQAVEHVEALLAELKEAREKNACLIDPDELKRRVEDRRQGWTRTTRATTNGARS